MVHDYMDIWYTIIWTYGTRLYGHMVHNYMDIWHTIIWTYGTQFYGHMVHNYMDIWYTILWTYGTRLWGTASNPLIDILERFLSKVLRIITDAPWYVLNAVIKHDLRVPSVRQEVRTYSVTYSVTYHARHEGHPNDLATSLLQQTPQNRRLKRYYPADRVTRF